MDLDDMIDDYITKHYQTLLSLSGIEEEDVIEDPGRL